MNPENETTELIFETGELRRQLQEFLETLCQPAPNFPCQKIGDFKFGVYAFFDYDGEPIYVGQTNEKVRTRIRRHLTNQRTDAVAMSVLDPFEVKEIEVWPLPQFQGCKTKDPEAKQFLDALERLVYEKAIDESRFSAVLNEKLPPEAKISVELPSSFRATIVSDKVFDLRSHPDARIARRSQVIARLAQVIAERKVQDGLRHTLWVQAKRLEWLASRRLNG